MNLFLFFLFQHQQCSALFNRIKFTRLLLTALMAFTKKEVTHTHTHKEEVTQTSSVSDPGGCFPDQLSE